MNQLHALAMSQGLCRKNKLWMTEGRMMLENLALDPWASRRRRELLQLLDQLDPWIEELDRAVIKEAESRPEAAHLMTQPGVGPVTALAFVLTIGSVDRFPTSKHVVSYLGLNPSEESSGGKQRLGAISKQGNSMMRYLLCEAAHRQLSCDGDFRHPTNATAEPERGVRTTNHGPSLRSNRWLVKLSFPRGIPGDESWSDAAKGS
jgi:transposase